MIVFGINVDEPESIVEDFVNEFQLTYPVLLGTRTLQNQYELASNYVAPYPRDFIIGGDGLFAYAADTYDPEAMIKVIEEQIALTTSVDNQFSPESIQGFALEATYPNPIDFTGTGKYGSSTQIVYRIGKDSDVKLQVFDIAGRLIRTLTVGNQLTGKYRTSWDGRNRIGGIVPSGVYMLRLQAGQFQQTRRIILVR